MTMLCWRETDRKTLARVLPEALAVLPVGATEQHGPHLPTGTDIWLSNTISRSAVARAEAHAPRALVLLPPLEFGASDHHLVFGATLSLTPETMLAVLLDLTRSVARAGCRRMLIVNGHGGNSGLCQSAAATASARSDMTVAHVDYWTVLDPSNTFPVPGHAGGFETALMLSVAPDQVGTVPNRESSGLVTEVADIGIHSAKEWIAIDGYTDHPERATADAGEAWLEQVTSGLAARLVDLAGAT